MTTHLSVRLALIALLATGAIALGSPVTAQTPVPGQRKQMRAVRIEGVAAPRLDGRLDDAAWKQAEFVSDFLQKEPDEGTIPTQRTEVAILYDRSAIYVGARMYSDHPEAIRTDVNRRDNPGNAEQIILSLDTYFDRRTAYDFCVSSAGVRMDRYHAEDVEYMMDRSYNVVWDAQAQIDSLGWTAEMRIPFSQLRFSKKRKQVWGINWNRWIPSLREDNFWIYVPRNETGWASRFGNLVGIEGIEPSRRIELLPYMAGDGRFTDDVSADNPFRDGADFTSRIGGDLKMGLGPNLTLDATVNPDFGQVEADPAEVNLSAFETSFQERRPFFIEGSQLFDADGPTYYYSRRIGRRPYGRAFADFVKSPQNTTIPAAAKVTGRLSSGLSVGGLLAVTGREYARTYDSTSREHGRVEIEPPTGYGVLRLQQEFGENASTAGIILTGVERDLDAGSTLAEGLRKQAFSGGLDWNIRFQGGAYDLRGYVGFSRIAGDSLAILAAQRSSARYFQRPDADYVTLDPSRTSLSGYTASLRGSKRSGKHWLWGAGFSTKSPGFEINDLGILRTADDIDVWANIRYRETNPGPVLRSYSFNVFTNHGWNYGGIRQYGNLGFNANATWNNYWNSYLYFSANPRTQRDSFTRGGPTMSGSSSISSGGGLQNNFSATTRYGADFWFFRNALGGWGYGIGSRLSTRGTRWEIAMEPSYNRSLSSRQYIMTVTDNGGAKTYGNRYVFSWVDQSMVSAQVRVNYFFTPDLSLEVYAEPFAASGRYFDFGELTATGEESLHIYGPDEIEDIGEIDDGYRYRVTDADGSFKIREQDFGFLSFRSNIVLRWEFRLGSTLYLVWQQNRFGVDRPGQLVRGRSLWDSLSAKGDSYVAVKFSYWWAVS